MKQFLAAAFGLAAFLRVLHADVFNGTRVSFTNAGADFVVSWPVAQTDCVLEQAAHLAAFVPWSRVSPGLYQSDAASRFVRVSATNGNRFYRLRKLGPSAPGLTGMWPLDEGAGVRAEDGRGLGPDLQLVGAAWAAGRFGAGSLHFNGEAEIGRAHV